MTDKPYSPRKISRILRENREKLHKWSHLEHLSVPEVVEMLAEETGLAPHVAEEVVLCFRAGS